MLKRIILLLAATWATLALSAVAHATTVWENPGAAPFAASFEEARTKMEQASPLTDSFFEGVPEEVRKEVLARMSRGTASSEWSMVHVDPDDNRVANGKNIGAFERMMSGPDKRHSTPWVMTEVEIPCIPVPKDPDRCQAMKAWHTAIEHDGVMWHFYVPLDCSNVAFRRDAAKEAPPPQVCAELHVPNALRDDRVTFGIRSDEKFPPGCWAFKEGAGEWQAMPLCFNCFVMTDNGFTIRVPLAVIKHEVTVCVYRNQKPSCMKVIEPSDWGADHTFTLTQEWKWTDCIPPPKDGK